MSKLEQLINELCPDGVEYKKIKEIAEVGTGGSNGNEAIENGKYPFYSHSLKYQNNHYTVKGLDHYIGVLYQVNLIIILFLIQKTKVQLLKKLLLFYIY